MKKLNPLVSIIIPTYNREKLIDKTIYSIINQTYQNIEIIVVDDCSKDKTIDIVNGIKDSRIVYKVLDKNQGAPAARNIGIQIATGDYIAFLDSDDRWEPNKLELQLNLIKSKPNVGVVYTGIKVIDETSKTENVKTPNIRGQILQKLLIRNCVGSTSSVLIDKELLLKVNGFDLTLKSCQDWDLWIRLAKLTEFDFVEEPLLLYYIHEGERISTNFDSVYEGHFAIYKLYKDLIEKLPSKDKQDALYYIGKIILKSGVMMQDQFVIEKGRNLIKKGIKAYPYAFKNYSWYMYSHLNINLQRKIYKYVKGI